MKVFNRLAKLFVSIAFFLATLPVNVLYRMFGKRRSGVTSVLLYHSVAADERERFAAQMDTLLKLATPVDATQPQLDRKKGRQVAVTFDDGYRSFRINALPELMQRKIPAALFVPSRCLGKEPKFLEKYGPKEDDIIMSEEELLALPEGLVTIGSHSQTHPHLPRLDKEAAWQEIAESRKDLESLLGKQVTTLSFPYGEYNEQILALSRQAGYERVFSALPGGSDIFLCGRIDTEPKDWPIEFKLKVMGAYRWLTRAVTLKQRLQNFLRKKDES